MASLRTSSISRRVLEPMRATSICRAPSPNVAPSAWASVSTTPASASDAPSPSPPINVKSAVFLAPLGERPPPVHGRRRHHDGDLRRIERTEDLLQILDQTQRALGATGHGIGEEIDVLEPHHAPPAEHRDRLHTLSKPVDRIRDLAAIVGKTADDLA